MGFDYGNLADEDVEDEGDEDDLDELQLKTAQGHEILSERDKVTVDQLNKQRVLFVALSLSSLVTFVSFRRKLSVAKISTKLIQPKRMKKMS